MSDIKTEKKTPASRDINMLEGSIAKKILIFAMPLALTGILQQLFNAADVAVVGQLVGKNAMAAVGANTSIIGLLINLFVGVSLGSNVVISQAIGGGNRKAIHKCVHTSIVVALLGGLLTCGIGELIAQPLLGIMDVPDEVMGMAVLYLRIYLAGMPVIMLYNFEAAILRSQGDTRSPLISLLISGILNVGLNIFFVMVCHMTVEGVALATVVSNLVSSAYLLLVLMREGHPLQVHLRELEPDLRMVGAIFRIGLPAGVQSMVFSLSNICVQAAINSLGADVMAASSAAFNIEIISYFVLTAFGQAATSFVGQNYGAGQMERCRKVIRVAMLEDAVACLIMQILILALAEPLLRLFTGDPSVIAYGKVRIWYIILPYLVNVPIEVLSGAMRGYGKSLLPAVVTVVSIVGSRLFWIYAIFPLRPEFSFLMLIYPVSWVLNMIPLVIAYFSMRRNLGEEEPAVS